MDTSNVNIFLRVRQTQRWEHLSPVKTFIDFTKSTEKMFILEEHPYIFDKIFYGNTSNKEVFNDIKPNVERLLEGYNCCILAYGQSGSGKTYTMGLNENNIGMISLCLDSIFQKLRERKLKSNKDEYSVSVSYIEIYNEKVFDLFNDKGSDSIHTKGTKFAGSIKIPIQNSQEAKELLLKGNKIRHTRSTLLNAKSSRSHAMFTIILHTKTENSEKASVLRLVDLAGSEGLRRTNHSGLAQQEGVYINQGLLTVGKVIQALSNGKSVVPYRESVLTLVLLDCLNLDSYFTLIACISPALKDRSETLSTIRFAQSCKSLENKIVPEVNIYLKEQQRLKAQTPFKGIFKSTNRNAKTPKKLDQLNLKTATSTAKKITAPKKFKSFITPSAKKVSVPNTPRYTYLRDITDSSRMDRLNVPKESFGNNTFNMNVSCSTEIDGPSTAMSSLNVPNSIASSFYVNQNTTMPSFSPLMRRIEQTIDEKLTAFMNSFRNQTINVETTVVRQQLKDAVRMGIEEVNLEKTIDMDQASTFEVTSFPACSTIARAPKNVEDSQDNTINSRRINKCKMTFDLTDFTPVKSQTQMDSEQTTMYEATNEANKTVIQARRSTRILEMKKSNVAAKVELKVPPKINRHVMKNKILAMHNANTPEVLTKKDHKKAIMDIINKGNIKEIQLLPTIGKKTAHQILTHRYLNGNFEKLLDVKNGLGMTDKAWKKFLEKNHIN